MHLIGASPVPPATISTPRPGSDRKRNSPWGSSTSSSSPTDTPPNRESVNRPPGTLRMWKSKTPAAGGDAIEKLRGAPSSSMTLRYCPGW